MTTTIKETIQTNFYELKKVNLPEEFYKELNVIAISYNDEILNQMKLLEWKLQSSQEFLKVVDEIWNLYIIYDEKFINDVKQLVKEQINIQLDNLPYTNFFSDNRLETRYTTASKKIVKYLSTIL